ncbi:MAG: hypothetical protein IJH43_00205 [Mogibacterium sp.]|nr:hypothetical protein [Mogibacterium sp.]
MSDSRRDSQTSKRRERQKERFRDIMQDTEGNVIYTGAMHRIAGEEGHSARVRMLVLLVITAAIVISSGCIDAGGAMGAFYVIFPYIGEVSSLFALAWSASKLFVPAEIRTYVLNQSGEKIPGACRMLSIFAIAGLILSAVYLMRNGMGGEPAKNILYLGLKLMAALAAELFRKQYSVLKWEQSS